MTESDLLHFFLVCIVLILVCYGLIAIGVSIE